MKRARKWLTLMLVMVMLLTLTACGEKKSDADEGEIFDVETVLSQLEITEYAYNFTVNWRGEVDESGGNHLCFLVKNNSNYNLKVPITVTLFNENNEVVKILHEAIRVVEKGREAVALFEDIEEYEKYTYEIDAEKVHDFNCVMSHVSQEFMKSTDKVFSTITYEGSGSRTIDQYLLCYKNNKMIYCHKFASFVSSGESKTSELEVAVDDYFDNFKVVVCLG